MPEVIWLTEERRFGWLLKLGAHMSLVMWHDDEGRVFDLIENNEYEVWEDHALDYESDDE